MRKYGQGGADNDVIINKLIERIAPTEQSPENLALLASDLHNRIESLLKYKVEREIPQLMPRRNYTIDGLRRLGEDQSLRPELNLINDYVGHTVQEESEMLREQQIPFEAERYRPTPHLSSQQESDIYRSLKHRPLTKKEKKEIAKLEKQFLAQHPGIKLTKPEEVKLELEKPHMIQDIGPVSSTLPKDDLYKLTEAINQLAKNVDKEEPEDYEDIQKQSRKFAEALETFRSEVPTDQFLLSKFLEKEQKEEEIQKIKAQRERVEAQELERRKKNKPIFNPLYEPTVKYPVAPRKSPEELEAELEEYLGPFGEIVPEGQERVIKYKRPKNVPIYIPFEEDQPVVYEPPWYKSLYNRFIGRPSHEGPPLYPYQEMHTIESSPPQQRPSYEYEVPPLLASEEMAEERRRLEEMSPERRRIIAEIDEALTPKPPKEKGEFGTGRRRKKGGISHEAAVLEYRRKPRINQMKGVPYPYYFELNPYKMKLNEADLFTPVRKLYNHDDFLEMHGQQSAGKEPLRSYAPHGPTTVRKPRKKRTNKKM
jgi:hypothetical protein